MVYIYPICILAEVPPMLLSNSLIVTSYAYLSMLKRLHCSMTKMAVIILVKEAISSRLLQWSDMMTLEE